MEILRGFHARASGPFVIEAPGRPAKRVDWQYYRCDAIFDSLTAWLRVQGVKAQRPLHTLRKEYGSQVAARFGIYAAQQMLGHADIATTAMHYLETKDRPMVGLGHLLTD